MSHLNYIDIIILLIFLISLVVGFGRGFVSEMISLITLIAAFVIATLFASPLATLFTNSSSVQSAVSHASNTAGASAAQPVSYLAIGISFVVLFVGTIIVGLILKGLINLLFTRGVLGVGNRILGAIFGIIRGYLINLVLIFIVQLTSFGSAAAWQQSQFVPFFQPQVIWLGHIVSPTLANFKEKFGNAVHDVTDELGTQEQQSNTGTGQNQPSTGQNK